MTHALVKVSQSVSATQLARLSQMSGFEKMCLLNDLAGNHTNGGWEAADHQWKIIEGEYEELRDKGIKARNIHEVRDGIADLLVTVLGLAHRMGINADADLHEVVLSNLTKFDPSDTDDVRATVAKYLKIGVETVQLEVDDPLRDEGSDRKLYVTKSAYDQHGQDEKKYPKGKWLKSANFVEPEFAPLPMRVQDKLGLVTVRRDVCGAGCGVFVEPGDGGYYARALMSFTITTFDANETVNQGDIYFVVNKDVEFVNTTLAQATALTKVLDAVEEPTKLKGLVNWTLGNFRPMPAAGGAWPTLLYADVRTTQEGGLTDVIRALGREIGLPVHELDLVAIGQDINLWFQQRGYALTLISFDATSADLQTMQQILTDWIDNRCGELEVIKAFCSDASYDTSLPNEREAPGETQPLDTYDNGVYSASVEAKDVETATE